MKEEEMIERLKAEGFDKVWVYEAAPGEVDEEHAHNYDTKLVILDGAINITSEIGGAVTNVQYKSGGEVIIPRNKLHSATVGTDGCRYIVAEKH